MDKDLRGVEGGDGGEPSSPTGPGWTPPGHASLASSDAVLGGVGSAREWLRPDAGWRREEVPAGPVPAGVEPQESPTSSRDRSMGGSGSDPWGQVVAWLESAAGVEGGAPVWQLGDGGLREVLVRVGQARALIAAAEVAVVTQVVERGVASAAGFSVVDWVRQAERAAAPLPGVRDVTAVVSVAKAVVERRAGAEVVAAAVASTLLPVGKASQVTRFVEQVRAVADPEDLGEWVTGLVAGASDDPVPSHVDSHSAIETDSDDDKQARMRRRGVDERELARELRLAVRLVKPAKDLEDLERRQRLGRGLTRTDGGGSESGMAHYRMTLDPEGAAVLDAAVSALSAPRRLADGALEPGELADPRSAATRRADALLDLVGRAVAAGGGATVPGTDPGPDVTGVDVTGEDGSAATGGVGGSMGPGLTPAPGLGVKAQVVVTIDYDALVGSLPGAGVTLSGELLSAAVVRRMACDARILPMVLGAEGQVLDLGRARRLHWPGQRLVVWRRDRHCTYPGCSVPATWCDVHHTQWWSRGGGTDVSSAALLCRRHHTVVHERDLVASVDDTGVRWHASPW